MGASLVLTYVDWEGEGSAVKVPGLTISAANHDAQVALMATLKSAVNAVTECELVNERRVAYDARTSGAARASAKSAQRERKWLVRMTEATDYRKLTLEIPGADLSLLDDGDTAGKLDITTALAPGTALKDAIEAYYKSDRGYGVTVDEIVHVGRNT